MLCVSALKIRLSIGGMHCGGCVSRVEGALRSVDGVEQAEGNLGERTALVAGGVTAGALISAGKKAAELRNEADMAEKEAIEQAHYRQLMSKAIAAGWIGGPLMVAGALNWLQP